MDYTYTIQKLKDAELVKDNDIVIACMDAPSMGAMFWGGAIGAALSASKGKFYLMSVNNQEIRLFDIDKKTGDYLNIYSFISVSDIIKASIGGLGNKMIIIKTVKSGTLRFSSANKFKSYHQKAEIAKIKDFFKTLKR